jgi:transcriptional regulator with XRE-family HTH domain
MTIYNEGMLRRSAPQTVPSMDLAALRSHLGVSQNQLAREMGVDPQQIWKWERSTNMRTGRLASVVDALGRIAGRSTVTRHLATLGDETIEIAFPSDAPPAEPASSTVRAFRVRAWNDHRIERAFIDRGFVAVSDDNREVKGPYPANPTDDVIRAQLNRDWPDKGRQTIGIWTSYWRTFLNSMQTGDVIVFAPKAPWVAIGTIAGPYRYDADEPEGKLRHQRPVGWVNPDVTRSTIDADLLGVINAPGTICEIDRVNAAERLIDAARA